MRSVAAALAVFFVMLSAPAAAQTREELLARGGYIMAAVQGCVCHTPRKPDGSYNYDLYLAGAPEQTPAAGHPANIGFPTLGWKRAFARNLTPDPETGIGRWTESDFLAVMKTGRRPDGKILDPIMPWPKFQAMTDTDLRAIWAYLQTIKPIKNKVPDNVPLEK